MAQFTARLILDDNDQTWQDATIDMEWDGDDGPITWPQLIPTHLFPRRFPGDEAVTPAVTDYWDFQYVASNGLPIYKYRSDVP